MKLSEMTTNQATDALILLAEPAAEIVNDDRIFDLIKKAGTLAEAGWQKQIAFIMREVAPVLLKDHRDALYTVLSIMTGKTPKQIGEQRAKETYDDIKGCLDSDLIGFFTPLEAQEKKTETES